MKIFRRIFMTLLFFTALINTFGAISNVEAKDYSFWIHNNEKSLSSNEHDGKLFSLMEKFLFTFNPNKKELSNDAMTEPQNIEEVLQLDKYPTKTVLATGYTAGIESTGKTEDHPEYGITYSGVKVKRDLYSTIAADINVFPLGTILFIPGYGYGVVADIGGAINGNKIDLYYETVDDVYKKWGKKHVKVYIIKKGNGKLSEEQLNQLNNDETLKVFRDQIMEGSTKEY